MTGMTFHPDNIYHIYNQGNNRQTIFLREEDYLIFLRLYRRVMNSSASMIAWCLMPNHFHFMVHTDERCTGKIKQGDIFIDPLTNGLRKLLSGYARIFNRQYKRSGSVFRQKTKAISLSEIKAPAGSLDILQGYFRNCFHYIHQNPLVANLVTRLEDWEYSSFRDYAGLRNGNLCQKDLAAKYCGYDPAVFIQQSYEILDKKIIPFFQ